MAYNQDNDNAPFETELELYEDIGPDRVQMMKEFATDLKFLRELFQNDDVKKLMRRYAEDTISSAEMSVATRDAMCALRCIGLQLSHELGPEHPAYVNAATLPIILREYGKKVHQPTNAYMQAYTYTVILIACLSSEEVEKCEKLRISMVEAPLYLKYGEEYKRLPYLKPEEYIRQEDVLLRLLQQELAQWVILNESRHRILRRQSPVLGERIAALVLHFTENARGRRNAHDVYAACKFACDIMHCMITALEARRVVEERPGCSWILEHIWSPL